MAALLSLWSVARAEVCGEGIAAMDLSGNCRTVPTTMGALEAFAAIRKTTIRVDVGRPQDEFVHIGWLSHPDLATTGYRIYAGDSLDFTKMRRVRDVTPRGATSTIVKTFSDLNLAKGSRVCVRLTAFNADGESPATAGVCTQ